MFKLHLLTGIAPGIAAEITADIAVSIAVEITNDIAAGIVYEIAAGTAGIAVKITAARYSMLHLSASITGENLHNLQ